jgi:predicted TIM-barrel enzyme
MPDQGVTEPSHGEILRAIGVLEGQLRQLLDAAGDHARERLSLTDRVAKLENRMAQVVIIAVIVGLTGPVAYREVRDWVRGTPPTIQRLP